VVRKIILHMKKTLFFLESFHDYAREENIMAFFESIFG